MLVLSVILVAVTAVLLTIYDIRRLLRAPLLRFAHSGLVVMLPPLAKHQVFDLFLSHAQDFGQDQVATIKSALEKLLPSVNIFLDVECLDDLHVLDELVQASAAVLLFLTKGCLQRHFVRLEIKSAVQKKIKMIVVQETDTRHGSAPMAQHREDCPEAESEALFESKHREIVWIRESIRDFGLSCVAFLCLILFFVKLRNGQLQNGVNQTNRAAYDRWPGCRVP